MLTLTGLNIKGIPPDKKLKCYRGTNTLAGVQYQGLGGFLLLFIRDNWHVNVLCDRKWAIIGRIEPIMAHSLSSGGKR